MGGGERGQGGGRRRQGGGGKGQGEGMGRREEGKEDRPVEEGLRPSLAITVMLALENAVNIVSVSFTKKKNCRDTCWLLTCTERALATMESRQSRIPTWLMVAAELTASAMAL